VTKPPATRDDTALFEDLLGDALAVDDYLRLERADYVIRRPIVIPSSAGLMVSGAHLYGTKLIWAGDDDVMFVRDNSRDHLWRNFTVDVQGPLRAVFRDTNMNAAKGTPEHDPSMIIPSNNRHERLRINGNDRLDFYRLIVVGKCDENNEAHSDHDVHVNRADIGWFLSGSQAKYQRMVGCRFNGGNKSQAAVQVHSGSFSWLDGGGGLCDTFFLITDQTDTIAIHRADVESCGAFLNVMGPKGKTGSAQPIDILGGRFMTDQVPAGRAAIYCASAGPLSVRSFQMGSGKQPHGRIVMDGFRCKLTVRDCMFGSYGSSPDLCIFNLLYDSAGETTSNVYHTADGESYIE